MESTNPLDPTTHPPFGRHFDPGAVLLDPARYAMEGNPDEVFKRLRDEAPICRVSDPQLSYWAVTRHRDVVLMSRDPRTFSNVPHFQIVVDAPYGSGDDREPETLIQMDPPMHRRYREIVSQRFTPRALRSVEVALDSIADEVIDSLEADGASGACDFVARLAAPLPMAVIAWLLEVPRSDWPELFDWTNAVALPSDPAYRQAGEDAHETRLRSTKQIYDYFLDLARERARGDGDDLVSIVARARIDGEPLSEHALASFYLLLVVAGNETTRNAISGGMHALLENPARWDELAANPGVARDAVEECLRWSSPIVNMARNATRDLELHGQKISKGDTFVLFYPSANRDERVFDDPYTFRFDRRPNPHLSFGIGEHFCLGAHLARIEIACMLRRLTARFEAFESAGKPERLRASAVGGWKTLPVRYVFKRKG